MTNTQFNEADHPRGDAGKFAEKPAGDPGAGCWQQQLWTRRCRL